VSSEPLLRARSLSWSVAGKPILKPLDLDVRTRECLAIIGPNGAGKTTLLRLLTGLLEPTTGAVECTGRSLRQMRRVEAAQRIAYVPQVRPARVPLTVRQVVLLGRFPLRSRWRLAPGKSDLEAAERALRTVGLESLAERLMDSLSGGERQGVYIAAALAQESELLVLDEPTTHLDPRHQVEIARLLAALRTAGRHTIVFTTHDLNLAAAVVDRVLALRKGEVVALESPDVVIQPATLERVYGASFEIVERSGRRQVILELQP
jgi:ABC-type cobalamin/Fe3+-siderophores transport system ATPase subunit